MAIFLKIQTKNDSLPAWKCISWPLCTFFQSEFFCPIGIRFKTNNYHSSVEWTVALASLPISCAHYNSIRLVFKCKSQINNLIKQLRLNYYMQYNAIKWLSSGDDFGLPSWFFALTQRVPTFCGVFFLQIFFFFWDFVYISYNFL